MVKKDRWPAIYQINYLEMIVQTQAEHFVGTAIDIGTRHTGSVVVGRCLGIVVVGSPEIGDVQAQGIIQTSSGSESQGVGTAIEAGIGLEVVTQSVIGFLETTTDGQVFDDIPFDTGQVFVGTVLQSLLTVVEHTCPFVVEEVVFYRGTQGRQDFVTGGHTQESRNVARVGRIS